MLFIVATNVVASRPPEQRLTGAQTARAKKNIVWGLNEFYNVLEKKKTNLQRFLWPV